MPRGRKAKPINYTEELERIDLRIVHHQNSIKELNEKKEKMVEQKRNVEMNQLMSFMEQHQLTPSDILSQIHA